MNFRQVASINIKNFYSQQHIRDGHDGCEVLGNYFSRSSSAGHHSQSNNYTAC